jgi:hypothetical protein
VVPGLPEAQGVNREEHRIFTHVVTQGHTEGLHIHVRAARIPITYGGSRYITLLPLKNCPCTTVGILADIYINVQRWPS